MKTILLAEDNQDIRDMVEYFFTEKGFVCLTASDGAEAIDILKAEKIDLLVTDFRMPRFDGVQVLQWCRSQMLHFPVILISANDLPIDQKKIALHDCCATYLKKPIDLDVLDLAVESALAGTHHSACVHSI